MKFITYAATMVMYRRMDNYDAHFTKLMFFFYLYPRLGLLIFDNISIWFKQGLTIICFNECVTYNKNKP